MDLHVSLENEGTLSGQIYRQIRASIRRGDLRPGQVLPSTRELARRLNVARNTANMAYDRLVAEGFLTSRPGVGTFVAQDVAEQRPDVRARTDVAVSPQPIWTTMPAPAGTEAVDTEFDFRAGLPDAKLFPYPAWRRLMSRQLRSSAVGSGAHIDPAGHRGLRDALARHVSVSRGIAAAADDVIVTNGTQQAVDLLARVVLAPGDIVAVEDPGYAVTTKLLTSSGMSVAQIPVDAEGIVVDAIPDAARLVHVTPSHQFPLGVSMSLPRRLALLRWARRVGALVVEDDYDSEFRFAGRPFEPLAGLDDGGHVAYVGSFSKTLLPTLRLGFIVAPPSLRAALTVAKQVSDWHTNVPAQAALAEFIDEGLLAKHLRSMRRTYAGRHHHLSAALRRDFGGYLNPIESLVGLHVTALLNPAVAATDVQVVERARERGVECLPLSMFATHSAGQGLILGYGRVPVDRMPEALSRLRQCVV